MIARSGEPAVRSVHPLTPHRWDDLERLFGPSGACWGCWCMYWRIKRKEMEANGSAGNRRALRKLVLSGAEPGLLAYEGAEPVGWCSVGPRETYGSLERSHVLRRIDDRPVWSLVCLFVARGHRGSGVASELVAAAVRHAGRRGATTIEAYPRDPGGGRLSSLSSYMGTPALFEAAGFHEVARPSDTRVVMRRKIRRKAP